MTQKYKIKYQNLAYLGAILAAGLMVWPAVVFGVADVPLTAASNQVPPVRVVPPGFYQFNNLVITDGPSSDQAPATIQVTQDSSTPCVAYSGGNTNVSLPCPTKNSGEVSYTVQIDDRTTLLGSDRNPAILGDLAVGDKINVLGWVSNDFKTINAAVLRDLESKQFHQAVSGTVKNVTSDGFTLVMDNGSEIKVKTPIVEGVQVTVTGFFDQANSLVNNVIDILIKQVVSQIAPSAVTPALVPTLKAPSTLFRNFLKVFGL